MAQVILKIFFRIKQIDMKMTKNTNATKGIMIAVLYPRLVSTLMNQRRQSAFSGKATTGKPVAHLRRLGGCIGGRKGVEELQSWSLARASLPSDGRGTAGRRRNRKRSFQNSKQMLINGVHFFEKK